MRQEGLRAQIHFSITLSNNPDAVERVNQGASPASGKYRRRRKRKRRKRKKNAKKSDGEGANAGSSGVEDESAMGEASASDSSSEEDENDDEFRRKHSDAITQLAGMGFDDEAALAALKVTGGDLQTSVQLLLSSRDSASSVLTGANKTNPKSSNGGRGKIASRLLAAVPQDTRPDAAPINIFGNQGGAGAEKEGAAK